MPQIQANSHSTQSDEIISKIFAIYFRWVFMCLSRKARHEFDLSFEFGQS